MTASALDSVISIMTWCIILIVGILAAAIVLSRLRRRAVARDEVTEEVFSLEALEEMLAHGQITLDEYRKLRRAALGLGAAEGPPAESSSSPPAADVDAQ
jgi:uncharacterized membrane protein